MRRRCCFVVEVDGGSEQAQEKTTILRPRNNSSCAPVAPRASVRADWKAVFLLDETEEVGVKWG